MARKSRNRNRIASRSETKPAADAPVELAVEMTVANEPITGVPVTGKSVAGKSVTGKSVTGKPKAEGEGETTTETKTESVDHPVGSAELLKRMADQVAELHRMIADSQSTHGAPANALPPGQSGSGPADEALLDELRGEVDELASMLRNADAENEDLRQQNNDLAARLASTNLRSAVSSPQSSVNDALTWDQRKALILKQMERDDFDANGFIGELSPGRQLNRGTDDDAADRCDNGTDGDAAIESPIEFVQSLQRELTQRDQDLRHRDDEIAELKMLLQQRQESQNGGFAFGAAAIAELVDSDELVMQERQRLQALQDEWEEKFRRSEIEASLERAKLARERQQLANKTAELDEQLEHIRREARQTEEVGKSTSRRWLTKLGLNDAS